MSTRSTSPIQWFIAQLTARTAIALALTVSSVWAQDLDHKKSGPEVDFNASDLWDVDIFEKEDHKVLVIHDRKYTKAKRFELGLDFGTIYNNPFFDSVSYGGRAAYHFTEYLAVDAFYNSTHSWFGSEANRLNKFFEDYNFPNTAPYIKTVSYGGMGVKWSPVYGKLALFRSHIIYFDLYGILGLAHLTLRSDGYQIPNQDHSTIGSLAGAGARVFFSQNFSARIEVKNSIYKAKYLNIEPRADKDTPLVVSGFSDPVWRNQTQVMMGISYLFGKGE